jgi:hypothetical protein
MPAKTPPESFTVDLDRVEVPHLDLGGPAAEETPAKPARTKKDRDRRGSGLANRGLRAAPQAKRYAFRRS